MSALQSATALCRVRVLRTYAAPSHPHVLARAFCQQAAVRSGPCRRPRAEFFTSGPSRPLITGPWLPARPASRHWRAFRHLSQQPNSSPQSAATRKSPPAPSTVATSISNAEQRRRDWAIVRRLAVHIWPKGDWGTRGRVVLGVGMLISGKVRHTSALFPHFSHGMNVVMVATKRPGPAVLQGSHRHA